MSTNKLPTAIKPTKRARAPEDLIVFRLQSPQNLDSVGVYSPMQTISGFPWKVNVAKEEDEDDGEEWLGIYLHCDMDKKSSMWFCDTKYTMTLVNQRDAKLSEIEEDTHRFENSNPNGIGASRFLKMEKLINQNEGFIKDDEIIIHVIVTVKNSSLSRKFRSKVEIDLTSPSPQSDGILLVDATEFYVNKQLLALQSPYFEKLFNGKFKEAKQKKISIEDVDEDEFDELLKAMYPIDHDYTEENVEYILKLADRFECNHVLNNAEKFLMANTEISTSRKLLLADKYKLTVLIDKCLSSYKSCAQMKELKDTSEYPDLSDAVKATLFDRMTDVCKC